MANAVVTEFEKISAWFKKVFKKAPAWNVAALSALNVAAPLVEEIVDLTEPAQVSTEFTKVVTQVPSDMGTVASLLSAANTANLSASLSAINATMPTLLTEAHITDPASVAKAEAAAATITSELEAIIAAVPAAS